jgi:hypothetical protein
VLEEMRSGEEKRSDREGKCSFRRDDRGAQGLVGEVREGSSTGCAQVRDLGELYEKYFLEREKANGPVGSR